MECVTQTCQSLLNPVPACSKLAEPCHLPTVQMTALFLALALALSHLLFTDPSHPSFASAVPVHGPALLYSCSHSCLPTILLQPNTILP